MKINCSLCGEEFANIHSVYYEKNDKIVDYCEDCEEVYIDQLSKHCEERRNDIL